MLPKFLKDLEVSHDGLTELHIVEDMHTRKHLMLARSAAVLVALILDRQAVAHAAAGAAGLATAYANTFWWCTGFTALALVPALLLSGRSKQAKAASTTGSAQ